MNQVSQFVRFFAVVAVTVALTLAVAPRVHAQASVGGGLVFTDLDPMGLGFQVNGYFALPDVAPGLRIGGDITYYLPESESESFSGTTIEMELSVLELNANGQFHFLTEEQFSVYGLGGLNITRTSLSASASAPGVGSESASTSDTNLGFNLGGGGEFNAGFGAVYGEAKYVVAGDNMGRIVLGAGVRFGL